MKFRPALPSKVLVKLKEIRKVRNKYYHLRQKGFHCEEKRILLRVLTRESKVEIGKYKAARWQSFLSDIQQNFDEKEMSFWTHLSRIYKPRSLPFYKLAAMNKVLSVHEEITGELCRFYSEQFKEPLIDLSDAHDVKLVTEYSVLVKETSTTEIMQIIKTLKPKKSSGDDRISNFMIKKAPLWPGEWKIAKIITLNKLKAGIPNCDQTRPISLLATHSKLFEKVLLQVLSIYQEIKKTIWQLTSLPWRSMSTIRNYMTESGNA